jgi:hypothetical protein
MLGQLRPFLPKRAGRDEFLARETQGRRRRSLPGADRLRRVSLLALSLLLASLWTRPGEARTQLDITIPEEAGSAPPTSRWLVEGTLSFVPGVLTSTNGFMIVEEAGEVSDSAGGQQPGPPEGGQPNGASREVPIEVTGEVAYPDGSLMFVDIRFPLTLAEARSHRYWLEAAPHGRTGEYRPQAGEELPVMTFVLREETSPTAPAIDVNVGQMLVRVDEHPGFYYYWYLVPMGGILALLVWRKLHLR